MYLLIFSWLQAFRPPKSLRIGLLLGARGALEKVYFKERSPISKAVAELNETFQELTSYIFDRDVEYSSNESRSKANLIAV